MNQNNVLLLAAGGLGIYYLMTRAKTAAPGPGPAASPYPPAANPAPAPAAGHPDILTTAAGAVHTGLDIWNTIQGALSPRAAVAATVPNTVPGTVPGTVPSAPFPHWAGLHNEYGTGATTGPKTGLWNLAQQLPEQR